MIRFPIPALALALSCAPVLTPRSPACFTPCGLAASEGDCDSLRRYETRTVQVLSRAVPEWRADKTCAALKKFRLLVHRHDLLIDATCSLGSWRAGDSCYYGLTSFSEQTITIADDDWGHSALAHEIAHVAEAANTGHPGHCRWTLRFRHVLESLSSLAEVSTPEASCAK